MFTSPEEVTVEGRRLRAKRFIIATGSTATVPAIEGLRDIGYVTHIEALRLAQQPKELLVIDAGPRGLEFAQLYARFGSTVTVLQRAPSILPRAEAALTSRLAQILTAEGITLKTGVTIDAALVAAASPSAGGQGYAGTSSAGKTVELTLVAGKTSANSSFNFNGYSNGKMTLAVPAGWAVVVHYQNFSPLRHTFDVILYTGKQPGAPPPPPAFQGATTRDPVNGIGVGKEETITFLADKAGRYEYLCGVAGHAPAGMWNYLVVSSTAKAPSVRPARAAAFSLR